MSELPREEETRRYIVYRQRYIQIALPDARAKVAALENEARRYGMLDLIEGGRR